MLFKLDEILGPSIQRLLEAAGHDCSSVPAQNLCGKPDHVIASVCHSESRCLITLDTDFTNPTRFPPANTAGIVVLRPGGSRARKLVVQTVQTFLAYIQLRSIAGKLVVVEPTRVRIYPRDDVD
jgi:predicted nuclease of predicted toxin-antitoxin system